LVVWRGFNLKRTWGVGNWEAIFGQFLFVAFHYLNCFFIRNLTKKLRKTVDLNFWGNFIFGWENLLKKYFKWPLEILLIGSNLSLKSQLKILIKIQSKTEKYIISIGQRGIITSSHSQI
jgi:hypothetical protein